MSNRTNKYAEKAKNPEIKIDGVRVKEDCAEWHVYFQKRRYFDFLRKEKFFLIPILTDFRKALFFVCIILRLGSLLRTWI